MDGEGLGCLRKRISWRFVLGVALNVIGIREASLFSSTEKVEDTANTVMEQRTLPKFSECAVLSEPSRANYFAKVFGWFLFSQQAAWEALKPEPPADPQSLEVLLAAKNPGPLVKKLCELLSEMVLSSADRLIELTPQIPPMISGKLTPIKIYTEVVYAAVEQMLALALSLGYLDEFVKWSSERSSSLLFDAIKTRITMEDTPHIAAISDDDCPRQKFSEKQGQCIVERAYPIMREYVSLFYHKEDDCGLPLSPKIASIVMKQRQGLGSSSLLPANKIGSFFDTVADCVVKESNKILEELGKKPDSDAEKKSIFDIYTDVILITLQHILPAVSSIGLLWTFANAVKSEDKKSIFNKKLTEALKDEQKAPYIMSQRPEGIGEKKFIKMHMHHIRTGICHIIKIYFDVFNKRATFGTVLSPL
jgi:hypothetical protein